MKVLFIIPNLGKGGAERVVSILLEHLDRRIIQLCCLFYDSQHIYDIPHDVKTYCLDLPGSNDPFKKGVHSILRIIKLKRILEKERPDVVLSFMNKVNLMTILASTLSRNKIHLIISERNTPSRQLQGRSNAIVRYLIKKLYPKANKILAVSNGVRNDLIECFGIAADKIRVIYNPLDIEKIRRLSQEEVIEHPWFSEKIPIIINVGSLSKKKGQKYLIEAFRIVRDKIPARLVLLGEGDQTADLKKLATDLVVDQDLLFLGFQKNPYKFMARSSVFVLASLWEGFPNVLTEAMACGVPVVSTSCPFGPEEIINNKVNGLLVPIKDEKKLADAIVMILENKSFSKSIAFEAPKSIERFSKPRILKEYLQLLTEFSGKG